MANKISKKKIISIEMPCNEERILKINKETLEKILNQKIFPTISLERIRELRNKIGNISELNFSLEKYFYNREQSINAGLKHGKT